MDWNSVVQLAGGLVVLVLGGEWLVRSASRLATSFGISPLVVGLTVVAMGTSAPELVVSVLSSWQGKADIAYGNVVGSNICNVLLILGFSAVIAPLVVQRKLVRVDTPIMVGAVVLAYLLARDGRVGRLDGLLLVGLLMLYTAWSVRSSMRTPTPTAEHLEHEAEPKKLLRPHGRPLLALSIAGSLALLILGSNWFVGGAVSIARSFGVSELVIGLTIVALGTSMPELVTSVVAALRGERDIAVGNVIGSNLFNVLGVLGAAAAIAPDGVAVSATALQVDTLLMVLICVACVPIFFSGWAITRLEGAQFVAYYVAYTSYLVLDAQQHALAPKLAHAVLWYALPASGVWIAVACWRSWRADRANALGSPGPG